MPKKGYKQTIAHRKKHSMSKIEYYKTRYSPMKNRLASVETKRKHHLASVGKKNPRFGIILTKAIRKKISIGNKGKQSGKNNPMFGVHRFGKDAPNYGTILSEETRQKIGAKNANQPQKTRTKQRLAALRRIAVHRNSGDPVTPNLGTNEIYECTPTEGLICKLDPKNCPIGKTACNNECYSNCDAGVFTCESTGAICYI